MGILFRAWVHIYIYIYIYSYSYSYIHIAIAIAIAVAIALIHIYIYIYKTYTHTYNVHSVRTTHVYNVFTVQHRVYTTRLSLSLYAHIPYMYAYIPRQYSSPTMRVNTNAPNTQKHLIPTSSKFLVCCKHISLSPTCTQGLLEYMHQHRSPVVLNMFVWLETSHQLIHNVSATIIYLCLSLSLYIYIYIHIFTHYMHVCINT